MRVVEPVPPLGTVRVPENEESERQVPLMEKHPAVRLMPLPAVVVPRPRVSDPMDALCEKRLVDEAVVEKRLVVVALVKVLLPVKELLLVRSVVEEMVMLVVPSKVTPLIVRAVASLVALVEVPMMVWVKVLEPEKVLLSARSVEEAAPARDERYPLVIPHASAEVVEKALPRLRERKTEALVVLNALP